MRILLLGGRENSGKTETLINLRDWLKNNGWQNNHEEPNGNFQKDFICWLSGGKNKIKNIILNTAADDLTSINKLKEFIQYYKNSNNSNFDNVLLISAIRAPVNTAKDRLRKELLDYLQLEFKFYENDLVEMPVTHIYRSNSQILDWYNKKVLLILEKLLANPPFEV